MRHLLILLAVLCGFFWIGLLGSILRAPSPEAAVAVLALAFLLLVTVGVLVGWGSRRL